MMRKRGQRGLVMTAARAVLTGLTSSAPRPTQPCQYLSVLAPATYPLPHHHPAYHHVLSHPRHAHGAKAFVRAHTPHCTPWAGKHAPRLAQATQRGGAACTPASRHRTHHHCHGAGTTRQCRARALTHHKPTTHTDDGPSASSSKTRPNRAARKRKRRSSLIV